VRQHPANLSEIGPFWIVIGCPVHPKLSFLADAIVRSLEFNARSPLATLEPGQLV
jgi:hypothetical protein